MGFAQNAFEGRVFLALPILHSHAFNPNTKMQFNYDYTQRGDTNNAAQGHIHAFGTRMAYDF